jgi:demethylmenaquinone methyltransferase/2-methoxy-6-polyprenyl-1,4-benzoquinol methylase
LSPPAIDPSSAAAAAAREARYFDRLVREEGDFNPFADRGWATLARAFAAAAGDAGLSGALRLVDVGCGTGQSQRVYAEQAGSYFGLDLSLSAVATANRRRRGRFLQADATRLPLADQSRDVVAFSSVLHHLPDRDAALREAHRVLRPGGLVFAFDPNLLHPAMALFRHPRSPLYHPAGVSPDERPLLPRALRRDFARAGFVAVRQRCRSDIPYRNVAPAGFDRLLSLYNRLDRWWELVGLGRWLGSFVVTWGRRA